MSNPIIDSNGLMVDWFRSQWNELLRLIPLKGTGSPEGALLALQYREYIDTAATLPGTIKYIKQLPDIAGDKTKGWVLI